MNHWLTELNVYVLGWRRSCYLQSLIKIFMSMNQQVVQATCGAHSLSAALSSITPFSLSFLSMFCLFPLLLVLSFVPVLQIRHTINNSLLILKPLFIYSVFHTKNIKEVNTTDSSTQPLICSFLFSLSPVRLADVTTACVAGQNCSRFRVWLEDNCGFFSSRWLSPAKSPNSILPLWCWWCHVIQKHTK